MKPVPPLPAVMTTVTLLRFDHGEPKGNGRLISILVRFNENSDVKPTSGIVPAWFVGTLVGRKETWSSITVT